MNSTQARHLTCVLAFAASCARAAEPRDPNIEDGKQSAREGADAGPDSASAGPDSATTAQAQDAIDPPAEQDARDEEDLDAGSALGDARLADAAADAAPGFSFLVSNIDVSSLDLAGAPAAVLDCGAVRVDTSEPVKLENWCGTAPTAITRTQDGGPDLVVIALERLSVAASSSLVITGTRPALLLVRGDVEVRGAIDVSATGPLPGPGGNQACELSTGGDGVGRERSNGGGGGGGGFGTAGGPGGDDRGSESAPGEPGRARAATALVPLLGGCGGGHGGGCAGEPGAGGGALQISSGGALVVTGTLRADGGEGAEGCVDDAGGTGGGSGGALLLEAETIDVSGAKISAAGGTGGPGQRQGDPGAGARSAKEEGSAGESGRGNGTGGGGGGFGRVLLRAAKTCTGCEQP